MKIKLTQTIKADAKHGLFTGRVFDAVTGVGLKTSARWQIVSDANEVVEIFNDEAVLVDRE